MAAAQHQFGVGVPLIRSEAITFHRLSVIQLDSFIPGEQALSQVKLSLGGRPLLPLANIAQYGR